MSKKQLAVLAIALLALGSVMFPVSLAQDPTPEPTGPTPTPTVEPTPTSPPTPTTPVPTTPTPPSNWTDADGDGWTTEGGDCDDADWSVNPSARDAYGDGRDSNCDGADGNPDDLDGDSWPNDSDCEPLDPWVHPYAPDSPNDGRDADCDGLDTSLPQTGAQLRAFVGDMFDTAILAVYDNATEGFDAGLDTPQAPAPADPRYMEAYFSYPENEPEVQRLSTSVIGRAPRGEWPLEIAWHGAGNFTGGSLYWGSAFSNLPPGWTAYLLDGANVVDMRAQAGYGFPAEGDQGVRRMTILLSTAVEYRLYLEPGWSLKSVPVVPVDARPAAIFRAADSVLAWDGTAYVPATAIVPGAGYWVHMPGDNGTMSSVFGEPVRRLSLELQPGWNLVGTGIDGGWVEGPSHVSFIAQLWDRHGYYETAYVPAGSGAWIYSHEQGANITLGLAPFDPLAAAKPAAPAEFLVPLVVSDASGMKDSATLQAKGGATNGFDGRFDSVEPPAPASPVRTQAYFLAPMRLDRSVVAPAAEAAYQLRLERDGPAGAVTLTWPDAALPEGYVVELVDGTTRVPLLSASSYTFDAPAGASTRALQVTIRPANAPVCLVQLDGACLLSLPRVLLP